MELFPAFIGPKLTLVHSVVRIPYKSSGVLHSTMHSVRSIDSTTHVTLLKAKVYPGRYYLMFGRSKQ